MTDRRSELRIRVTGRISHVVTEFQSDSPADAEYFEVEEPDNGNVTRM